jgi:prepilin-type N-terminal cleavage/methylation domain-containing protein/prepilin-type processing-associated H-X9-DG protein
VTRPAKPNSEGFTLTELLMVVVIVALLASLLVVPLRGARSRAQSVACKNLLRQIGYGLQMYVHDHQAYPPLGDSEDRIYCFDRLSPYYPLNWTNLSWNCPSYVSKRGVVSRDLVAEYVVGISYAYNASGCKVRGLPEPAISLRLGLGGLRTEQGGVAVPSEMYAVADARCIKCTQAFAGCIRMVCWSLSGEVPPVHGEGYNLAFCDGHVGFVLRKNYLYPPRSAANWNNDHQPHAEAWAPRGKWAVQE